MRTSVIDSNLKNTSLSDATLHKVPKTGAFARKQFPGGLLDVDFNFILE